MYRRSHWYYTTTARQFSEDCLSNLLKRLLGRFPDGVDLYPVTGPWMKHVSPQPREIHTISVSLQFLPAGAMDGGKEPELDAAKGKWLQ